MFGKIFCRKNACDVIRSVRSYPAEYYFAAEQASGHGTVRPRADHMVGRGRGLSGGMHKPADRHFTSFADGSEVQNVATLANLDHFWFVSECEWTCFLSGWLQTYLHRWTSLTALIGTKERGVCVCVVSKNATAVCMYRILSQTFAATSTAGSVSKLCLPT